MQTSSIEFNFYFKNLKGICKENKLREFFFKFLRRIIVTKKELCLYGIECNSAYVYCQDFDSISPSFISCRWSKKIFSEVIKWFNKENDTSYSLKTIELLFGKLSNETDLGSSQKKNYVLLFAKCLEMYKNGFMICIVFAVKKVKIAYSH